MDSATYVKKEKVIAVYNKKDECLAIYVDLDEASYKLGLSKKTIINIILMTKKNEIKEDSSVLRMYRYKMDEDNED